MSYFKGDIAQDIPKGQGYIVVKKLLHEPGKSEKMFFVVTSYVDDWSMADINLEI